MSHLQTDLEERMAQELAVVHPRHCRGEQNQRVNVPEQHGDPQAALRRGVWLLHGTDDPNQGQTPQGHHVLTVPAGVPSLYICYGKLTKIF